MMAKGKKRNRSTGPVSRMVPEAARAKRVIRDAPLGAGARVVGSGEIRYTNRDIPSVTGGKSPAMDFSTALQGNPTATYLAQQAMNQRNQPKEETSLADRFVACTYTMGKRLGLSAHGIKRLEVPMQAYRNDMRKAHRFVLDNDFTKYATEVSSTTKAEKLLYRIQYAVLPYETTWIEFDLPTKVRTMHEIHGGPSKDFDWSQVTDRLGLLMRRINQHTAVVEMMTEAYGDMGFVGTLICYYFSTIEREWKRTDGNNLGCEPMIVDSEDTVRPPDWSDERWHRFLTDERTKQIGAASLWGYTVRGDAGMLSSTSQLNDLRLPSFLLRHGVMGYSRMWYTGSNLILRANEGDVNALTGLLGHEATEFTGMMRWVVCVLAMLNEVPISTERVEPEGTIRTGLTGRRPLMEYHKVTLRVPKTKPVQYIQRKLSAATRRRAHEVRSHWRTYLHEQRCPRDEHQWEYDHAEGYRLCGVCMAFGRLIHEHIRGDPSLGWVRKDYVVKPQRQE